MKVLVACEFSGIVRDAFARRGHDAISCDLEETELPGPHIKDDIKNVDLSQFDLLIAHPPCTYLSNVGNRSFKTSYGHNYVRELESDKAKEFFFYLLNSSVPKICVENPVGRINRQLSPTQIIHPYYFGHNVQKKTCFWLRNLPKLIPTDMQDKPEPLYKLSTSGKSIGWVEGGVRSSKDRSRTFPKVAQAMAEQWG